MPREIPSPAEARRITQKKRDAWWTVLLVDPVATPLVRRIAMHTRCTPNQLTWAALLLGLGSAGCFTQGSYGWLLAGALLYHVSFIFDCMDGKLARLTGTGSVFGAWLDFVFDRIRVLVCAMALMGGQYARTGDVVFLWLAFAVASLDALRYIDSLEIFKIRHTMRKEIKARVRAARRAQRTGEGWTEDKAAELALMEDLLRENPAAEAAPDAGTAADSVVPAEASANPGRVVPAEASANPGPVEGAAGPGPVEGSAGRGPVEAPTAADPVAVGARPATVVDLHREFRRRFPWYLRVRTFLLRHRVRAHLVSGIEFQMGVFIVGPLLNAVVAASVVSGVLLLVFELAIIYKLLLSTRDFTRTLASFETVG